jgi:hypothetical protein
MNRVDRLREFAKSLRNGPPGETKAQRREREGLRAEAERVLAEHAAVQRRQDVMEDPAVLEHRRRRLGNTLTERQVRDRLREAPDRGWLDVRPDATDAEPDPPPTSPALQALARAADPEGVLHEQAWRDTGEPTEGWLNA